ncbi:hypothetical protein [Pseudomonas sp. Y24-6]|uniref:hypothetical protein n=1 Tax=Pseudomonas sp. Y24-6 TaxID=2750013 RepID=UPI001CE11A97|nr:hypothetical protein [Pseudomonas sp. Y24-6]MCA4961024.1 hypothetical protein [Pseudomonas sp. Y24-6]
MTDKMREEFEVWMSCAEQGPKTHPVWLMYDANTNTYQLDKIQGRWVVWQASREALVIEWPDQHTYTTPDVAGAAILDCMTAFSKAKGLKVTP